MSGIHTHSHDHDHGHDHGHDDHGHGHHHHDLSGVSHQAFLIAIVLNSIFVLVEVIYGLRINSLGLLSDAGHNLSDVLSLALAWAAESLIKRKSFGRFTYGLKGFSIIIAFVNTVLLLFAMGAISLEAIKRFSLPEHTNGLTMSMVAVAGILVNGLSALLFTKGQSNVNIRATFLHLASDALVSLGVVIAGFIIYFTHLDWIDPVISLGIVFIIIFGTWRTMRDSGNLIMAAAPRSIEVTEVRDFFLHQPGVTEIHDLHVWNISTQEIALTAHIVVPSYTGSGELLHKMSDELFHQFQIKHATIQIENGRLECEQIDC